MNHLNPKTYQSKEKALGEWEILESPGRGDVHLIQPFPVHLIEETQAPYLSKSEKRGRKVPVAGLRASAGPGSEAQDEEAREEPVELVLPMEEFRGGPWVAIQVSGSSMENTIQHMDYVICRQMSDLRAIQQGKVYVLVTAEGIICKRAARNYEGEGPLRLVSDNPEYGLMKLDPAAVQQAWEVRAVLGMNTKAIRPHDVPRWALEQDETGI